MVRKNPFLEELLNTGRTICNQNWNIQKEAGIDLIPCNDFSYYDQVLDMSLVVGAIPTRYHEVVLKRTILNWIFILQMARGYQKDGLDITAMEMTKWFDTNYHYIVPEFYKNQQFKLSSDKIFNEFAGAKQGNQCKTGDYRTGFLSVIRKRKEEGFDKLDLAGNLLPVYTEILTKLQDWGAEWIQFDEPFWRWI